MAGDATRPLARVPMALMVCVLSANLAHTYLTRKPQWLVLALAAAVGSAAAQREKISFSPQQTSIDAISWSEFVCGCARLRICESSADNPARIAARNIMKLLVVVSNYPTQRPMFIPVRSTNVRFLALRRLWPSARCRCTAALCTTRLRFIVAALAELRENAAQRKCAGKFQFIVPPTGSCPWSAARCGAIVLHIGPVSTRLSGATGKRLRRDPVI
jgi:hypothetical protein